MRAVRGSLIRGAPQNRGKRQAISSQAFSRRRARPGPKREDMAPPTMPIYRVPVGSQAEARAQVVMGGTSALKPAARMTESTRLQVELKKALERYSSVGDWKGSLMCLSRGRGRGVAPTISMYNWVLRACQKGGRWNEAVRLLSMMEQRDGVVPSPKSFAYAIKACAKGGRKDEALDLLDAMLSHRGVPPDVECYTGAIKACGHDCSRALTLLQEMKEARVVPNEACFSAVLGACKNAGRWRDAQKVVANMHHDGVWPSLVSYSLAMSACAKRGQIKPCLKLFEEMVGSGLEPDIYIYNILISAYSKAGELGKIRMLFDLMKEKGIKADVVSYNSAVHCCAKLGRADVALEIFQVMQDRGIPPDEITYTTTIDACGKGGMASEAVALLHKACEGELDLQLPPFISAIHACGINGEWVTALEVMDLLQSRPNLKPNNEIYTTLMAAFAEAGQPERAVELLQFIKAQDGVAATPNVYSAAINAHAKVGDVTSAWSLLKEMKDANLAIGVTHYTSVVDACAKASNGEEALKVFQEAKAFLASQSSPGLDCVLYNAVIDACCRVPEIPNLGWSNHTSILPISCQL
ncbi:unnamed protein product [Chrysoparadoxa australica]